MASKDPYDVLGVAKTASADEIRKAFRTIAKKNHPDLNPGDKAAEERFKAANAANELLSDPEKRARFDRGEIDASGQERPDRAFYRDYAQAPGGARYRANPWGAAGQAEVDPEDLGDIFGDFFRSQGGEGAGGTRPRRGRDNQYRLEVPFLDTLNGATERLTLPGGQSLDVRIPPGLEDGQVLRLRGKGEPGRNGGPDGDALIEVSVQPHPIYRRNGMDVEMDLPVSFAEAVLGAKVAVPTPRGEVTLTVPKHSDTGARLRLRGRGVAEHGGRAAGDLFVTLRVVRGPVDEALETFLRGWAEKHAGFDPRAELRRQA